MKIYLLSLFFLVILIIKNTNIVVGQSIEEIARIEDPLRQLEAVLQLPVNFGKDTVTLKKSLQPVLEIANEKDSFVLKWGYYMRMADGYSIAFDRTNGISEQYYQLAEQLLQKHYNIELEMIGYARQGYYNYVYRKVKEAFPFFLRANDLKSKIDIRKIPLVVKHYQFIANFYGYIGDHGSAVNYLQEALPFSKAVSRERVDLTNAVAVYLSRDSLNHQALIYLNRAMEEAKLAKDSVWIGIISGNLADQAWKAGDKQRAIALVQKNIDLSMRYNEHKDAMRANLTLASWYLVLKEWELAKQHVVSGINLMEEKPYFLKYKMDASKLLADIAHGLNQKEEELKQLHVYLTLKDSLEKRINDKEIQKIMWQRETERYNRTIQSTEEKRLHSKRIYQFIGISLVLVFTIILLLINKSKTKIKMRNTLLEKDQLTLAYEKQLLDQELVILKDSLGEFTDTIKQNDTTIQQLRQEIVKVSEQNPAYMAQVSDSLNAMLQTHIMTDERWLKFKHVFDKVYPGYLSQMKKNYSKITDNDLRILALQKLDLNNSSMSELLCVSMEAIKKAKQRLKKKMESQDQESISADRTISR
ncbi:tetratricopeptide repeat protein [Sphingobacterium prati]|uniref:tetratricopeptide repeat protein n=1 Tax=Sphingobacterium prati TaxID=2737006 RepID=UPI0015545558|nr:hypothetical protein [Sphingobacterium prati]NPE45650.1 hypothetical protein [Sphingobacterium prati]